MTTKIQFYHLTATSLDVAVPKLMEKALAAGYRVGLWCADKTEEARLDEVMWTYGRDSFLPHGSASEDFADQQPVLTNTEENWENNPDILAVTHGATPEEMGRYNRVLDIFNGADDEVVAAARERWKRYLDAGHELQYFKQKPNGGWEQAA